MSIGLWFECFDPNHLLSKLKQITHLTLISFFHIE
jgi:hypothetical protein